MTREEFHNRYTIDHSSAMSGSFGTVYRTYDNYRDEWKAVKVAQIKRIGEKEYSLEKEFGITENLRVHKNVANYEAVYRFNEPNGDFSYAIMQYYEVGNLKELLLREKLTRNQKKVVAKGIILGAGYLHKNGILHRDIKPNNILISHKGNHYIPKITDFGISKNLGNHDLTNTGIGWTAYSSPELLKGVRLSEASDLWSIGIIIHELFIGHHPFIDPKEKIAPDETLRSLNKAIVQNPIPKTVGQIPYPFNEIVTQFLQKQPTLRTADIGHYFVEKPKVQVADLAQVGAPLQDDTIPITRPKNKKKRRNLLIPFLGYIGGGINTGLQSVTRLFSVGTRSIIAYATSFYSGIGKLGSSLSQGLGSGVTTVSRSFNRGLVALNSYFGRLSTGLGVGAKSGGDWLMNHLKPIALFIMMGLLSTTLFYNKDQVSHLASQSSSSIGAAWNGVTTWIANLGSSDKGIDSDDPSDGTMAAGGSFSNPEDELVTEGEQAKEPRIVKLGESSTSVNKDEGTTASVGGKNREVTQLEKERTLKESQKNENAKEEDPTRIIENDSKSFQQNDSERSFGESGSSTSGENIIEQEGVPNPPLPSIADEEIEKKSPSVTSEERHTDSNNPTTRSITDINKLESNAEDLITEKTNVSTPKEVKRKAPPAYLNSLLAKMVVIPSGEFTFGCDSYDKKCDDDEGPGEKMSMNSFEMMANEITQRQYEDVMGSNPSKFKRCPECPVESVSWYDAKKFVKKLNEVDPDYTYKLPTEAEWEYAATANSKFIFSGGNSKDFDYISANRYNSNGRTRDVGLRRPNSFGIRDMTGNVSEWCDNNYEKTRQKAIRGGSYMDKEKNSRINNRRAADPGEKFSWIGFRVMRKKL